MIIAVASQKGGVGKTSSSISLAAGIAYKHKKVLLIDIDSQANSSKVLLPDYQSIPKERTIYATILNKNPLPIHNTTVANLDIVPSHILLSNTDVELTTAIDHREARLKKELDLVKGNYDFIIIDCPPTLSWLTINAMTAADRVLVVVSPGYFELDSIVQIGKTIKEVKDYFNPNLELAGFYSHNQTQQSIVGPRFKFSDKPTQIQSLIRSSPGIPICETHTFNDKIFSRLIRSRRPLKLMTSSSMNFLTYDEKT